MKLTRLFIEENLDVGQHATLSTTKTHYLKNVLRLKPQDKLIVFNGDNHEYLSEILVLEKQHAILAVLEKTYRNLESPLNIHLIQAISKGERMEYTLQKCTELGVSEITPVFTKRTEVKLSRERLAKKMAHWQGILEQACMQSGRNKIPVINPPILFNACLAQQENVENLKIILDTQGKANLRDLSIQKNVSLAIGPEGGFEDSEFILAEDYGFVRLQLGNRILRTETAGPAALASLQALFGDLGIT